MARPLVFAMVFALCATAAWADRYSDCVQSKDLDSRIRGCTQIIERANQETPINRSIAHFNRGLAYHGKGEVHLAIADFDESIVLNPDDADAYINRGAFHGETGEIDRAISDYTVAIALDPNHALAYANRGGAYDMKGNFDRAIADYTKAIALSPNYGTAYFNRGFAYEKKGDTEQAIADYRKTLEIDPSDQLTTNSLKALGVTP